MPTRSGIQFSMNYAELETINEKNKRNSKNPTPYIGIVDEILEDYILDCYRYITRGYRINFNSFELALKSVRVWHNETCNIWTHLFSLFGFLLIVLHLLINY